MFGEQFSRPALLPRRETATVLASSAERRCISVGHVRAEKETEIIEKEFGEGFRRFDGGKHHLRHLVQNWVDTAMDAFERPDPPRFSIVCKRVEHGAWH